MFDEQTDEATEDTTEDAAQDVTEDTEAAATSGEYGASEVADTPHLGEGSTGAGVDQGVRIDTDENDDPKSGGTPVHPAPTEDSPRS